MRSPFGVWIYASSSVLHFGSSPRDSISVHRHIWGWKLSNCQNWLVKRQEKNGEISCIKAKLCMMTAKLQNLQWNTNDYALPALWLLRGKLSLVISFLTPGSSLIWREMLVKKQFLHKHTYCPAKLVNIGFFPHLKFWVDLIRSETTLTLFCSPSLSFCVIISVTLGDFYEKKPSTNPLKLSHMHSSSSCQRNTSFFSSICFYMTCP